MKILTSMLTSITDKIHVDIDLKSICPNDVEKLIEIPL